MSKTEYNLLTRDMFDRLPLSVIESPEGQAVIRYFCDKLTADHESEPGDQRPPLAIRLHEEPKQS